MNFESEISEVSSDQLDSLFKGVPDTTVTADTLPAGIKQIEGVNNNSNKGIIDGVEWAEDSLFEEGKNDEKPIVEDKNKNDEVVEEDKKEENESADKFEEGDQSKEVLQSTTNFLIEKGLWQDFEGRENFDGSLESYGKLAMQQNQQLAYDMFDEMVNETGDYGKHIINHIKNGGNPDEIIDLFKEQKQIESIDTSEESGKQEKIEKYYTDVLGWKPERVAKHVKRLIEDNGIDEEFGEVDELYKGHFQKKLEETNQQAKEVEQKRQRQQKEFVTNIEKVLSEDVSLTAKERKIIQSSITDFKHKLPDGRKVNDFYLKFAEIQSDPKKYAKFVEIALDMEAYEKKVLKNQSSNAAAETFKIIKGGAALDKNVSNNITVKEPSVERSPYKGTNFSFSIKK